MVTCQECGGSVVPSRFCGNCGSPLDAVTVTTVPVEQQERHATQHGFSRQRMVLAAVIVFCLIVGVYVFVEVPEWHSSSDSASQPVASGSSSQSDNVIADSTPWNDSPVVSPMDNSRMISITNTASDGGTEITGNPVLTVTCFSSGDYDVSINVGVGGGRSIGAAIPNRHLVRLKFDNNSPDVDFWRIRDNTAGAVMYTDSASDLVSKLEKADSFLFEFTPLDKPATTATFQVSGLQKILGKYPECSSSGKSNGHESPHPSQDSSVTPNTTAYPNQPATNQ